jgi:hypothetical protein
MVERCEAQVDIQSSPDYMILSGEKTDVNISCERCPLQESLSFKGESLFTKMSIRRFLEDNCQKWQEIVSINEEGKESTRPYSGDFFLILIIVNGSCRL